MPLRTAPISSNEDRLPTVNPGANGMAPTPLPLTGAAVLIDQLQPRGLGLRLVAGGAGEVGADIRVHKVDHPPAAAQARYPLPPSRDGAYALQLGHQTRDVVRTLADLGGQLLAGEGDLTGVT